VIRRARPQRGGGAAVGRGRPGRCGAARWFSAGGCHRRSAYRCRRGEPTSVDHSSGGEPGGGHGRRLADSGLITLNWTSGRATAGPARTGGNPGPLSFPAPSRRQPVEVRLDGAQISPSAPRSPATPGAAGSPPAQLPVATHRRRLGRRLLRPPRRPAADRCPHRRGSCRPTLPAVPRGCASRPATSRTTAQRCSASPPHPSNPAPLPQRRRDAGEPVGGRGVGSRLQALWAGPLCAHLLGLAGARVIKVETRTAPTEPAPEPRLLPAPARRTPSVVLVRSQPAGRGALKALVDRPRTSSSRLPAPRVGRFRARRPAAAADGTNLGLDHAAGARPTGSASATTSPRRPGRRPRRNGRTSVLRRRHRRPPHRLTAAR